MEPYSIEGISDKTFFFFLQLLLLLLLLPFTQLFAQREARNLTGKKFLTFSRDARLLGSLSMSGPSDAACSTITLEAKQHHKGKIYFCSG